MLSIIMLNAIAPIEHACTVKLVQLTECLDLIGESAVKMTKLVISFK